MIVTVTNLDANPISVTTSPIRIEVSPFGPTGPQGPPGDITASETVIWEVGQAWGTDAWGYGDLDGTATANTTSLQAALDDVDNWQELIIRTPPNADIHINDTLTLGECSGKTIRILGTPNGYGSPSTGGRIVMDTDAIPIFEVGPVTFARALNIKLALAYANYQTDPGAIGFKITASGSGTGGQPHNWQVHVDVENAYDGLKFDPGAGSAPNIWGSEFKVRALDIAHSAIDIVCTGSPTNTFDVFAVNTASGIVPTGPAVNLWNMEAYFSRLNIEDWADTAVYLFGGSADITNLHIERHVFTGVDNSRLCVAHSQPCTVRNANITANLTAPGTLDGYGVLFYEEEGVGLKAGWTIDNITTNFPAALAGRIALVDGATLSKTTVGAEWNDLGTKAVELCIPDTTGGFFDTSLYFGLNALWTVPSLPANWVTPSDYQVPRYRRVGKVVYIEGITSWTGGGTSNATLFTLPAHMRPADYQLDMSYGQPMIVLDTGVVRADTAVTSGNYVGLKTHFGVS